VRIWNVVGGSNGWRAVWFEGEEAVHHVIERVVAPLGLRVELPDTDAARGAVHDSQPHHPLNVGDRIERVGMFEPDVHLDGLSCGAYATADDLGHARRDVKP
jgi:hypothetical protein